MATGIILAGGASIRMPGEKAFMEVGGRRVIDIQLQVTGGLFTETLIVGNAGRMEGLSVYRGGGVRVVEEKVSGKGPLGGILSGLELSGSEDNFVMACDMPFINRDAIVFIMENLPGFQVAVPRTPEGLEPLYAAYRRDCADVIGRQIGSGNLKVTDFYDEVLVKYVRWEELLGFDSTGRLLLNINSPEDMRKAAGLANGGLT
ncbi:MAG: molybdenum cofactor guanylyltransferase [Actinobacteria bacterium]|nr:molybdenum cofactor guanylyltransferase [Actinomycetota bacterium]MCG2818669.1 molybdenum cofactor guanylyltransferase [Actinomycetes bacterium]MBU4178975.1 molybdenum cofactor guanylyltransferase [Actinomycetota bacterium]MBU4218141.1 molybdenum cofactor guanylyltransferase [Actinomycetota bacterium]MBU4358566.1 molybdenum cofactor guanylyltransferase [Actinomycetota bacterium]